MTKRRLPRVSYDPAADVLYLSVRQAPAARGIEDRDGLVWRYDSYNKLIGVTILYFREHWAEEKFGQLVGELSEKLDIPAKEVERAIGRELT
jgi:uncharacterized protein YuzE